MRDWNVSIVPRPRLLRVFPGTYLWPRATRIAANTADERAIGGLLRAYADAHGVRAELVRGRVPVDISLRIVRGGERALGSEGYKLSVSRHGVSLVANARAGLFYGVQTLEQANKIFPGAGVRTRYLRITDWPAYRWRGIHLDVSRHFFGPRVIERYIDLAAHYKLNTFHWHLTDDQAWRIQIERYPLLTGAAACDSRTCPFYTQSQIRRIVAYAALRGVTIVPEIDVPGHAGAALAAYPSLACAQNLRPHVLCPTDATLAFVKNVLSEVIAIFPGRYIHAGGDEVDVTEWQRSRALDAVMRREHLATFADVQPYFTRRLARFLRSHGRRLVGWDEIGAAAPRDAVIMLWRTQQAARVALQTGHDVVLSPDGTLYFDAYQAGPHGEPRAFGGVTTLRDVYAYEPTPSGLTAAERKRVLGAQANVWTEQIATSRHLFYMVLPRELALAELAWSAPERRDWPSFVRRLPAQFAWLSAQRYPFRVPNPACGWSDAGRRPDDRASLILTAPLAGNIRYTSDGSAPSRASRLYRRPLFVRAERSVEPRVRARVFLSDGQVSTITACEGSAASRGNS